MQHLMLRNPSRIIAQVVLEVLRPTSQKIWAMDLTFAKAFSLLGTNDRSTDDTPSICVFLELVNLIFEGS